jgi:hypothetical protein
MPNTSSTTDIRLDLTTVGDEGFELQFRTTKSYLISLSHQLKKNNIDGTSCVVLKFEDIQPVAARVDNYLSGTEYDTIGVSSVGPKDPERTNKDSIMLRVYCNRDQLRRFASLNSVSVEPLITFTATIPDENAQSFIDSVSRMNADSV